MSDMENLKKYPKLLLEYLINSGEYNKALGVARELFESLKESPADLLDVYVMYLSLQGKVELPKEEFFDILEKALELSEKLGHKEHRKKLLKIRRMTADLEIPEELSIEERYAKAFQKIAEIQELSLSEQNYFKKILQVAIETLGAERGALFIMTNGRLRKRAAIGMEDIEIKKAKTISNTIMLEVERKKGTLVIEDAQEDPRFKRAHSVIFNRIRSVLATPLLYKDKLIGVLYVDTTTKSKTFLVQDRVFIETLAKLLASHIAANLEKQALATSVRLLKGRLKEEEDIVIVFESKEMREILSKVRQVAPTDTVILLEGETGTGKGLLARFIHSISKRANKPFVQVDLSAIPYTLIESELFGYKKGAFTGALEDTPGLLEVADGGTVFFDEISNTTLTTQGKLLTLLEEKKFRRVGGKEDITFKARPIFASNKPLDKLVSANRVRKDFYYRISEFVIKIPPLRQRPDDIIPLAEYFAKKFGAEFGKEYKGMDDEVKEFLTSYHWPGNVRELRNVMRQAMIFSKDGRITIKNIPEDLLSTEQTELLRAKTKALKEFLHDREKDIVIEALRETHGNILATAELLNTNRMRIYRILKKYNIDPKEFKVKGKIKRKLKGTK